MVKGRKKQHVYNPCKGREQLILTQQGRAGIPEGLASKGCAIAASAENGDREEQHTSLGWWEGSLQWLQGEQGPLRSALRKKLASFPAVHFWFCLLCTICTVTDGHVSQGTMCCVQKLSQRTHTAVQARQPCHFPYSYCYRLPKHLSYLLIIGCPVPGMVLSK